MNGIRKKLFMQIGGLVILLVSVIIITNTLFLEPYYMYKQKSILLDDFDKISSFDTLNYDDRLEELLLIEASTRVDILIKDLDDNLLYTSNPNATRFFPTKDEEFEAGPTVFEEDKNDINKGKKNFEPPFTIEILETIDDKSSFLLATDRNFNIKSLVLSGYLDNQSRLELRIPLASIETNISLINNFLIIIGFLIFAISLASAYLISSNFTKPIREMNVATKKLKELDFSAKCMVYSNDEIGQLAENINEMSIELSNSISSLSDKNLQLEREINEKKLLAKKRKELVNNVSHELKTPLALIQGYAEGLKVNITKSKEKSEFYTDVILSESKKMNELVENILSNSQIDSGKLKLNESTFNLLDSIKDVTGQLAEVIKINKASLHLDKLEKIEVKADKLLIERVITNYLTNAIKHSSSPKKIEITSQDFEDKVRIICYNTSNPISDEEEKNIWDGFYKIDKARTRENSGHGLGLSIVSSIMNAHAMSFGSEQVKDGINFWFELRKI